jgi:hypothetical protein
VGRWSFLKDPKYNLAERSDHETPEYVQRYAQLKGELSALNFEQLSERLTDNRGVKDDLAKDLSDVNLNIQVIEKLIVEKLDAAGIESVVAGGYRLTPSVEPSFAKRDGQALRQWATETGQEDLLTINSQTLSSLAKEHFLEHGEPPPGVELAGTYTKLSRTKSR